MIERNVVIFKMYEKIFMYFRYVKFGYVIKMFLNIFYNYQYDKYIDKLIIFFFNGSYLS